MLIKNSRTSPLRIAKVLLGNEEGRLGLTLCPGKKDALYGWNRERSPDLE